LSTASILDIVFPVPDWSVELNPEQASRVLILCHPSARESIVSRLSGIWFHLMLYLNTYC